MAAAEKKLLHLGISFCVACGNLAGIIALDPLEDHLCWKDLAPEVRDWCCKDAAAFRARGCQDRYELYTFQRCCLKTQSMCVESSSQYREEDRLIRFFGWHNRKGIYVEIGALDGITFSNTLKLHTCLGWSGVLIEGNPSNFKRLQVVVPLSRPSRVSVHFGAVCAPPESNTEFIAQESSDSSSGFDVLSSSSGDVRYLRADIYDMFWRNASSRRVQVPCRPMSSYLQGVKHVDFFSVDVEGAELEVLSTIDFKAVVVEVFLVELEVGSSSAWRIRRLLHNLDYVECTRKRLNNSGIFIRRQGPYLGRC